MSFSISPFTAALVSRKKFLLSFADAFSTGPRITIAADDFREFRVTEFRYTTDGRVLENLEILSASQSIDAVFV